jgi:hypothetical protein
VDVDITVITAEELRQVRPTSEWRRGLLRGYRTANGVGLRGGATGGGRAKLGAAGASLDAAIEGSTGEA